MRESMVAWAGDCMVRGEVDLDERRLSDQVNEGDLLTFFGATLESLDDGHQLALDELEVERRELHLIEIDGHQGDPERRTRTIEDPVRLEIGPFRITGSLHRHPSAQPMAALTRRQRFVPVTGAVIDLIDGSRMPLQREVVLVNRELVRKHEPISQVPVWADDPVGVVPDAAAAGDVVG
ncbi:MAG TPA: hypothetical protein VFL03_02770 [Candidatus Limnocylindrales bacterium]|nr:hypothetical protein [Candidatus Limnocylindrales bacterium]